MIKSGVAELLATEALIINSTEEELSRGASATL